MWVKSPHTNFFPCIYQSLGFPMLLWEFDKRKVEWKHCSPYEWRDKLVLNTESVCEILKVGHVTVHGPFDLILHFRQYSLRSIYELNLNFVASAVPETQSGPKILKVGHMTYIPPRNPILHLWILRNAANYAIFEVYSFSPSPTYRG